jgi:hypothetical protein
MSDLNHQIGKREPAIYVWIVATHGEIRNESQDYWQNQK